MGQQFTPLRPGNRYASGVVRFSQSLPTALRDPQELGVSAEIPIKHVLLSQAFTILAGSGWGLTTRTFLFFLS